MCGIPIDPRLAWMAPLVEGAAAAGLFDPAVVADISVWQPEAEVGDWDTPEGACLPASAPAGGAAPGEGAGEAEGTGEERYRILVATHRPLSTFLSGLQHRPVPPQEQLDTLAHELAHTRVRSHGAEHERLTRQILASLPPGLGIDLGIVVDELGEEGGHAP